MTELLFQLPPLLDSAAAELARQGNTCGWGLPLAAYLLGCLTGWPMPRPRFRNGAPPSSGGER